jgi:hypothetical protein
MYPANEKKFWARVEKTDSCWLWMGAKTRQGYGHGSWHIDGRLVQLAHRVAYLLSGKTIPEGSVLDHICRNPSCVRPAHLKVTTRWENTHGRGIHRNALATHCPKGHPYEGVNLYLDARGWRGCRRCRDEAAQRHEERNPGATLERKHRYRARQKAHKNS